MTGQMSKCTFCVEDIDLGLPPACVAACPMRVLDYYVEQTSERAGAPPVGSASQHIAPLPAVTLTKPALQLSAHPGAQKDAGKAGRITNQEEIRPRTGSGERALVLFTLLAQMAVGAFITLGVVGAWLAEMAGAAFSWKLIETPMLAVGVLMGLALLASFFHLGTPTNAWRALANLRKSCLSREVLSAGLFTANCVLFGAMGWMGIGSAAARGALALLTAAFGIALIYNMARVYALRGRPSWDNPGTPLSFFSTAALLGVLFAGSLLALVGMVWSYGSYFSIVSDDAIFWDMLRGIGWVGVASLGARLLVAWRYRSRSGRGSEKRADRLYFGLSLASGAAAILLVYLGATGASHALLVAAIWVAWALALGGEAVGRVRFYRMGEEEGL
jgi:DMSO reductase anchor subunit